MKSSKASRSWPDGSLTPLEAVKSHREHIFRVCHILKQQATESGLVFFATNAAKEVASKAKKKKERKKEQKGGAMLLLLVVLWWSSSFFFFFFFLAAVVLLVAGSSSSLPPRGWWWWWAQKSVSSHARTDGRTGQITTSRRRLPISQKQKPSWEKRGSSTALPPSPPRGNKGAGALVPRGLGWEISSAGVVYCSTVGTVP